MSARLIPLGAASRTPRLVALTSFLLLLVAGWFGPYGLFIDEYYYFACSRRLGFGYVDHPPLAPLILRLFTAVFGDGFLALRLPAAAAGAATVWLTASMARRLGAGGFGQGLAAVCVMGSPILTLFFGFYSMNAFSVLLWTSLGWLLVEIEARREPRLWIPFGLLAGLAFENKHTVVLFVGALAVGVLASPARRHLRQRWVWLALLVALALMLPNLLWQLANDWPSLEFYANADANKNVYTPPLEALKQQILFQGPGTLPLWALGLGCLLFRRSLGPWRHLGWSGLVLLVSMVLSGKSRPDRIAGIYPILWAAGAAQMEALARSARGRWLRFALPVWMFVTIGALLPLSLPVLPLEGMVLYAARSGIVPQIEAGDGKVSPLPQWFADRTGWENHVGDVGAALDSLSREERETAPVLVPSYGHGGALELHGAEIGFPRVYSGHNSYWMWGPPPEPFRAAVFVGFGERELLQYFEEVTLFRTTTAEYAPSWRAHLPVWIARSPRASIAGHWQDFKHFE